MEDGRTVQGTIRLIVVGLPALAVVVYLVPVGLVTYGVNRLGRDTFGWPSTIRHLITIAVSAIIGSISFVVFPLWPVLLVAPWYFEVLFVACATASLLTYGQRVVGRWIHWLSVFVGILLAVLGSPIGRWLLQTTT